MSCTFISPSIEYSFYIGFGVSVMSFDILDQIIKKNCNAVGQDLASWLHLIPHRRYVTSVRPFSKFFCDNFPVGWPLWYLNFMYLRAVLDCQLNVMGLLWKVYFNSSFFSHTSRLNNALSVSFFPLDKNVLKNIWTDNHLLSSGILLFLCSFLLSSFSQFHKLCCL